MLLSKVNKEIMWNKAKHPPTFSCCCRNLKVQENHKREYHPLVEVTVNSMEIFVPITSKNYPSVHRAEHVVALSLSICLYYYIINMYFLYSLNVTTILKQYICYGLALKSPLTFQKAFFLVSWRRLLINNSAAFFTCLPDLDDIYLLV